jgi:iron complex outermembrane receptor protein
MKNIFLVIVGLLLSMNFYAQKLSGRVTNESGEPVPETVLKIGDTFLTAKTDDKGYYIFEKLKDGTFFIQIKSNGYEESWQTVVISGDDVELTIVLKQADISIEEVVVSAVGAGTNAPLAYTNIGKEEINKSNSGQDIPFLLENTPSMVVTSDAGAGIGYTSMRIRGTDMTRINFTVDGIPINDSESQGVWWVNMPDFASSTENIQIQRGAGTSTNGAGAFGANINMQTNKLNKSPYAEVSLFGGSFHTQKESIKLGSGLLNQKFAFDARFSNVYSDGYIDRAKSKLNSFHISATYIDLKNMYKFNIIRGHEETYQAWSGVPKDSLETNRTYNPYTYKNEIDFYTQTHFQFFYLRKITSHLNFDIALHYTHGEGYYEQFKHDEDFIDYALEDIVISDDTITSTDLIRRKWLDNDFVGTIYALKYQKLKNGLIVGGSWNLYTGNHFGRIVWAEYSGTAAADYEWYRNEGVKKDINHYIKYTRILAPNLNLWTDIQYRSIDYTISGIHDDLRDISQKHPYHFFNPKVGLSYQAFDKTASYLSFSVANREPSRSNFRDADADERFLPETLYDFEAGINYYSNKIAVDLNIYYMKYKNQLILTGEINDVGSYIMSNVPESYRTGIELSGRFKMARFIDWNVNAAFSKNIIKDLTIYIDNFDTWGQETEYYEETDISFSPSIVAGSDLSFSVMKGLNIGIVSKYVGKQYIDNSSNNDRALHPYFVNNLRIAYTLKTKTIKEIGFHLFINNLFNEMYESNAWVYRYYYGGEHYVSDGYFPQAGIHFLAGVNLKF